MVEKERDNGPIEQRHFTLKEKIRSMGPAIMVVGSLIGPGTITSTTKAGATYGYSLLWTIVFSIIAVIVLQGMAGRIGVVTQSGLIEEMIENLKESPMLKRLAQIFVAVAIGVGGIAYMGGDITGTAIGIAGLLGMPVRTVAIVWGICILILSCRGDSLKSLEKLLAFCVAIMLIVFVITAIIVKPDLSAVAAGLVPIVPDGGMLVCAALVGTTIVPYNLVLHSISARKSWDSPSKLPLAEFDTRCSMALAGLVTITVMITSATVMFGLPVNSALDMGVQLEPLLGSFAKPFICIGLAAAGISSAVITPLGVSYTYAALFGWKQDNSDRRFFITNIIVVAFGLGVVMLGLQPIPVIITAQAVNGVFLPVLVLATIYVASRERIMGKYKNTMLQNALGILVFLISLIIGTSSVLSLF